MTTLYWFIAGILVVVGIAGTVIPVLPGTPFIFMGLALAAWIEGFERVGWITLVILGVLTVISAAVDFAATSLGAKRVRASGLALFGAAIGTGVGIFFGIAGLIFAPFGGAVIGELLARRDLIQAGKAGLGTWLGLVLGAAAKLALAFVMVGIFATAYFL